MLIAMAGLPGSGKSSIAEATARVLRCSVVSVDPIESAMLVAGVDPSQPTGLAAYVIAEEVARQQLRLGYDVIVDAVNDVEPAREQWRALARTTGTALLFVEVICSDESVHRRRLGHRVRNLPGLAEPSWTSVIDRAGGFDDWTDDRLQLDSVRNPEVNAGTVAAEVERLRGHR